MRERTWLPCHVRMFEFFGGVPRRVVCDNLETGVARHPREGEIVLNDACEALAEHYPVAIMPAGVRKPKAKASAKGTVRDAATWVIAALRDREFPDLDVARAAVRERLDAHDAHPFQKGEGSRDEVLRGVEAAEPGPLPDVRYDVSEWVYGRKANPDFHVAYAYNRYSVPRRHASRRVDLKVGETTLSVCHAGERIATHRLLPATARGELTTDESHVPERFRRPELDEGALVARATSAGPGCAEIVRRILGSYRVRERALDPALSVPGLAERYGEARLESACAYALGLLLVPRYRHLKPILDSNLDFDDGDVHRAEAGGGHVRGADYLRGGGVVIDEETRRKLRELKLGEAVEALAHKDDDPSWAAVPDSAAINCARFR